MSDPRRQAEKLPPEQQAIRNRCRHPSGTFVEFPREDVAKSIPERFEKIVRQFPERIAVKMMGERSLTYDELNRHGNRIAHAILEKQTNGTQSVALFIEDRISMTAAILGWIILDSMPLMPNGKVNRRALPDPGKGRPQLTIGYVIPRSDVEILLARIWSEVLAVDQIGIHDNFFDLGGHSLAATRIISQIIEKLQLDRPIKSLFNSPTIAQMATVVAKNRAKRANKAEVARMLQEVEAMSDEQARAVFENLKGATN
jgi:acyl carrier protein